MASASFISLLLVPLILLLGLACFAFWLWMLIDCIRHEPDTGNRKVIWILVIVLAQFIGALVYFFAGRSTRR